jgi:thymidylate kinase
MKRKKIIAFFGIDGTGKTTIINALRNKLNKSGEDAEIVYMGVARNQKIPYLKNVMNLYSRIRWSGKGARTTYNMRRDAYRERNFLWLSIYYIELLVRYLYSKKNSKKRYILLDRYFYDGLFFAEGKNFSLFRRIIPKPDFCFLLKVPSKVIMERKDEAKEVEIKRFYEKAKIISKYFPIKTIDNTKSIDKVLKEITGYIKNEK